MIELRATPGPWVAHVPIAPHAPFVLTSDGGDPLLGETLEGGDEAAAANANLIAAAPELYEALAELLSQPLETDPPLGSSMVRASVALAKARGETA